MKQLIFFPGKNTAVTSAFQKHFSLRPVLLWIAFLAAAPAYAQQPFITTWKTDNLGSSGSTSISIPTTGIGYNYEVDWNNDGIYDQSGITGNVVHNFGVAGTYTIRIRGAFPRIFFFDNVDCRKLLDIGQWGDVAWTSMAHAFAGCSNLQVSATDLPNLSGVTDMSYMFHNCTVLNGPANIGSWNIANVTNMSYMFYQAQAFNQPIGNWNTANVTNMQGMLESAKAFNQPNGNWNTANVTNMSSMFEYANVFNQPIGNWNTANVTNMYDLFTGANVFNQPIGTWNTANVTNMSYMFEFAHAFNQPIGTWNTANVTDMHGMFAFTQAFNQPIGTWNIANVTNMSYMFSQAQAFNQPLDTWNTANVTYMQGMFSGAAAFNQSLGNWTLRATVLLGLMLNGSGLDCYNYSTTLIGWNSNPATPNGRSLGATGRQYGTNSVAARTNLVTKGWTIIGDAASGVDCSLALPVTLISFSGKQQADGILLEWQTASEQNNQGFHIERSEDGLRWTDISFVASKGTSTETQNYSFLDTRLFPPSGEQGGQGLGGTVYYRLRQTDYNGKEDLSKVVIIDLQTVGTVRVFPNPVSTGELTLFWSENTEEDTVANLFNSTGQLLRSMMLEKGNNHLNVAGLPTGVYTLQVGHTFEKIVVQN